MSFEYILYRTSESATHSRPVQHWVTALLIIIFVFSCLTQDLDAGKIKKLEIPRTINPLKEYQPHRDSLLLWKFEKDEIKNLNENEITGELKAGAKFYAKGRYGRGVVFDGGKASLVSSRIKNFDRITTMTVDFWCKLEAYPQKQSCLFEMTTERALLVNLHVLPEGTIHLGNNSPPSKSSEKKLPLGEWFHVAVIHKNLYQPNGIYVDDTGLSVKVNGYEHIVSYTGHTHYEFPPVGGKIAKFSVGNNLKGDLGLACMVDEFHMLKKPLDYYKLIQQNFTKPSAKGMVKSFEKSYRRWHKWIYHVPFDTMTENLSEYEPIEGIKKDDVRIDQDDDKSDLAELSEDLVVEEKSADNLKLVDGVRGKALFIQEGKVKVKIPEQLDLTNASMDFWFKPGNYDNFAKSFHPNSPYRYTHKAYPLMVLYGKPKSGKGEEVVLLKTHVRRAWRVTPDFPVEIQPHKWTHVYLHWGIGIRNYQPMIFMDGQRLEWSHRKGSGRKAKEELWKTHRVSSLELGNRGQTFYDEIRIAPYQMYHIEVANRFHEYTGSDLVEVQPVLCDFGYRLTVGEVKVRLNILDKRMYHAAKAELVFNNGKEDIAFTSVGFKKGESEVVKEVGYLKAGDYPIRGKLIDTQGKVMDTFTGKFRRLPTPWVKNRIGLLDHPPKPFEEVKVQGREVSTVLRKHELGDNGLFASLKIKSEEIFAAPMSYIIETNGRRVDMNYQLSMGESKSIEANWETKGAGGRLEIQSQQKIEYDGMVKVDLKLKPTSTPVKVDKFYLEIRFKEKYAKLLHVLPVAGDFRAFEYARFLPKGSGVVFDSKVYSKKRSVTNRPVGNFLKNVWLGGWIRGLCWFADNDRGWVPSDEHSAITVSRESNQVILRIHFIAAPHELKSERHMTFGLIATPPKPLPENHQVWNRGNQNIVGPVGGRLTSCDTFAPWEQPCRPGAFDHWPTNYDWDFAKRASDRQRKSKHGKYPPGCALMLYHDKRFAMVPREGQYFKWEWGTSYPPSKINMLVWYMDRWLSSKTMDGVYIDDVFPIADKNPRTGSAYILPDGTIQPGGAQFQYREYLKRMYGILAKNNMPPLITSHMTSTLSMAYHSFATLIFDCEDRGRFANDKVSFIDAWPVDRLLTIDNAERSGLVSVAMLKGDYASRDRKGKGWNHMIWRTKRSAAAMWLLFNMNDYYVHRISGLKKMWAPYFDTSMSFTPFFKEEEISRVIKGKLKITLPVTDKSIFPRRRHWKPEANEYIANQPIRVSIYKMPKRALFIFVNFMKKDIWGSFKIDLSALGVPQSQRERLTMEDVDVNWPEPEGFDIQRSKGKSVDASISIDKMNADDEEELGLDEESAAATWRRKGNTIDLVVREHNFRAIELRW